MRKVILSDVINIISGGTPKTSVCEYWENGSVGWLSINDFNNDNRKVYASEKTITQTGLNESNTKLLEIDDIIISARGTVGVLAQIGTPMAFNQSCFGIRGKKDIIDNTYLYYALKNYVANIQKRGQGSVFNTINLDSFKLMEISIEKNLSIQHQIAAVLSALDDKIELNNRINAELEQMARTLYNYWFVQFDFPDKKGKPYKSSGGKMVYNETLKREIPEGWSNCTVGDLASLVRGVSYNKDQIRESISVDTIRILRATNISGNTIDLNDPILVPRDLVDEDQILNEFDILMTMSSGSIDHIGKNGLFLFDEVVSFGAFCAKLVPNKKFTYYLYLYMQSTYLNTLIKNECLGTNINNLNSSLVKSFKLVKPDSAIIEMFNSQYDSYLC